MVKSDTESDKTTDYNDVANTEDFKDEVHVFLLGQRATYIYMYLVLSLKLITLWPAIPVAVHFSFLYSQLMHTFMWITLLMKHCFSKGTIDNSIV